MSGKLDGCRQLTTDKEVEKISTSERQEAKSARQLARFLGSCVLASLTVWM